MNKQIYCFILLLSIVLFSDCESYAKRNREMLPQEIYSLGASNISPNGKLAKIFQFNSDYTDLQREDTLEEIKNNVIAWRLPVYEVKRDGDNSYIIITEGNSNLVSCIIYLTIFNDNQKKLVHSLKTGSPITIKGLLTGKTFMRGLVIKPAVLLNN